MTGDAGDVAKHTHERTTEAEDSEQKARGLPSTKRQRTPSRVKLPGSSRWHLTRPSYMLQTCFLFLFYAHKKCGLCKAVMQRKSAPLHKGPHSPYAPICLKSR